MQGTLEITNLLGLLQALGTAQETGALGVLHPVYGELRAYFRAGNIVHAYGAGAYDHKTILRVLQDPRGKFEFKRGINAPIETVNQTLDNFLLEVGRMRYILSSNKGTSTAVDPQMVPKLLNPLRLKEMRFSADDSWLVIHLDGKTSLGELQKLERRAGQAVSLLHRLHTLGVIEAVLPPGLTTTVAIPQMPADRIPVISSPERLAQLHFSIDEFHIINNIDGQRTISQLQLYERNTGQMHALLGHLESMGVVEMRTPSGEAQTLIDHAPPTLPSSVSVSVSINPETLPSYDLRCVPVPVDEVRLKEARFSADDTWLVIHIDGKNNIAELQKLERRKGQLSLLLYRLKNKNLIDIREPSAPQAQIVPNAAAPFNIQDRVPVLRNDRYGTSLTFSSEELAMMLQIDGIQSMRKLARYENQVGQLNTLIERLRGAGVLELRDPPLSLKIGLSNELQGNSVAIDQGRLQVWERQLGRAVWKVRVRLESGLEEEFDLMASVGAESYILLSRDILQSNIFSAGQQVAVYPDV